MSEEVAFLAELNDLLAQRGGGSRARLRGSRSKANVFASHCYRLVRRKQWPVVYVDSNLSIRTYRLVEAADTSAGALLLEEGRRQFDRHVGNLDRVRTRAQFAFTTYLALGGATAAELPLVQRLHSGTRAVLAWTAEIGASLCILLAFAGATAVIAGGFFMSTLDLVELSTGSPLTAGQAAADYHLIGLANGLRIAALWLVFSASTVLGSVGAILAATCWIATKL